MSRLLYLGVAAAAATGLAAQCTPKPSDPTPAPAPSTTATTPAPAPTGSGAPTVIPTPPAQSAAVGDPSKCSTACNGAQALCNNPKPFAHCLSQCAAVSQNVAAPSADCLALTYTCDKKCP